MTEGGRALDELTEAFRLVYQGYSRPFQPDPAWMQRHVAQNDVRLDLSPLWREGGQVAALALLALRQERAWIGGFGVAPDFRGRGLSHTLIGTCLTVAAGAGATRVQLEVLEENERARATYQRAGFREERWLVVLEGPPLTLPEAAAGPPCWQRERGPTPSPLERLVNEPPDSPLAHALQAAGWRETARQVEMVCRLA